MDSLKQLYKIGNGPSSSHTMGPRIATRRIMQMYPDADAFKVLLQGSLAMTGKGHLTDYIIRETLGEIKNEIIFDYKSTPAHPNTMIFTVLKKDSIIAKHIVTSIGGGAIRFDNEPFVNANNVYSLTTFESIQAYCEQKKIHLYDYVFECEKDIVSHLELVYDQMLMTVDRGLKTSGLIPGNLHIRRKAGSLFEKKVQNETQEAKRRRLLCSYAYAVNEENASGGLVVTAPTCGASGVLPAVLKYSIDENKYTHEQIINALATAGLIGNLVKYNASISGAEAGCQAEVGTACSMAAAFYAELNMLSIDQIETASEIALEHHLGLTCDPVSGYVQIPCIERNAVAAMRAIDAVMLSSLLENGDAKISFDLVVKTMLETGKDLGYEYRETSEGGLAKSFYKDKNQ